MIAQYIENQQDAERDQDADFKVEPWRRPQSAFAGERKPTDFRRRRWFRAWG